MEVSPHQTGMERSPETVYRIAEAMSNHIIGGMHPGI
jgi:hypothetical protein